MIEAGELGDGADVGLDGALGVPRSWRSSIMRWRMGHGILSERGERMIWHRPPRASIVQGQARNEIRHAIRCRRIEFNRRCC